MSIVVDTSVFIDYLRYYRPAIDFFQKITTSPVYFSAITEAELISGSICNDNFAKEKILHFLSSYDKVIIENTVANTAGDWRRIYGLSISDAIIAATAFHTNSELITRDVKDFQKIKEIKVRGPY